MPGPRISWPSQDSVCHSPAAPKFISSQMPNTPVPLLRFPRVLSHGSTSSESQTCLNHRVLESHPLDHLLGAVHWLLLLDTCEPSETDRLPSTPPSPPSKTGVDYQLRMEEWT